MCPAVFVGGGWLFQAEADEKHKPWRHQHRPHRAQHLFPPQGTTCVHITEAPTLQGPAHWKVTARLHLSPASVQTGDG